MSNDESFGFKSLKPNNDPEKIKNYSSYKKILDFSFDEKQEIHNIGIVGHYGTGKSTLIETYLKHDLKNKDNYDVIRVSLLNLEEIKEDNESNIYILKHIIKQVVHNPKKELAYNILKFKNDKIKKMDVLFFICALISSVAVFLSNSTEILIPLLGDWLLKNCNLSFLRSIKYCLLVIIPFSCILYFSKKVFAYFKIDKLSLSSMVNIDVENSTNRISGADLDYLEYLVYLLKRESSKHLILLIEDIDRFEDIKIFQQLKEVNNLLNTDSMNIKYKFVYAVSNEVFIEAGKRESDIQNAYFSKFKDDITKFFDIIINITPVMDNQNSYEFMEKEFNKIFDKTKVVDEDLFMLSQYIPSPRVLYNVMNDFLVLKDMRSHDEENKYAISELKLFFYSILKNNLYNFYQIIHDVFEDLSQIVILYKNQDALGNAEKKQTDEFIAMIFRIFKEKKVSASPNRYDIDSFLNVIRTKDIEYIKQYCLNNEIRGESHGTKVMYKDILDYVSANGLEKSFNISSYTSKFLTVIPSDSASFSNVLILYYENDETICQIIRIIEQHRELDPNKSKFRISEFLDIDLIKLGIKENLLDVNDYNFYISNDYLEPNDNLFIKLFNLNENYEQQYERRTFDYLKILTKMKLEKIEGENGLNIFLIGFIYKDGINGEPKRETLTSNSMKSENFIKTIKSFNFESAELDFDVTGYFVDNAKYINTYNNCRYEIIDWFDELSLSTTDTNFIDNVRLFLVRLKRDVLYNLGDKNYNAPIFKELLDNNKIHQDIDAMLFMLSAIKQLEYWELLDPLFKNFDKLIKSPEKHEGFDNAKWLQVVNDDLESYITHFTEYVFIVIKEQYCLQKTIHINDISVVCNTQLFEAIYEGSLYNFSEKNIEFIRIAENEKWFDSYEQFGKFTLKNIDKFYEFIRDKKSIVKLELGNKCDYNFIAMTFNETISDDFNRFIDFLDDYNRIKLTSLEWLALDYVKIIKIIPTNMFIDSYENITYIYQLLLEEDNLDILSKLFTHKSFVFDELISDVEKIFDDNIPINESLQEYLLRNFLVNSNISIAQFRAYIKNYSDNSLDITSEITSEKQKAMLEENKLSISAENLLHLDEKNYTFALSRYDEKINLIWKEFTVEDFVEIFARFTNKNVILEYISRFIDRTLIELELFQSLLIALCDTVKGNYGLEKEIISTLISSYSKYSQDIKNIGTLLSNTKGQRKVSLSIQTLLDFLIERKYIKEKSKSDDEGKIVVEIY